MNRKFRKLIVFGFVLLFVFVIRCVESRSAQKTEQLSKTQYVDPKGYFKIVPPADFRIQEYQQDPRGKVAFLINQNVDLRVLVNSVDFETIEELLRFCKDMENQIQVNTNINVITFYGRQAVERIFELKSKKFYYVDFLVGKVDHNIAYSAPIELYEKYHTVAMKSMETYEPILKILTKEEDIRHTVAKQYRLAQLMIENGNLYLALEYANQGLKLDAKNAELLKLKEQIGRELKGN